jgi:hypothetical protein
MSTVPIVQPVVSSTAKPATPAAAPAKPVPADTSFFAVEKTWLQKHERLLIVAMLIAASYFGLNHYLDNAASKAETRAKIAESATAQANASLAASTATAAQVAQMYQAMNQALSAQNASLAAALVQRQAATVAQQKTDATLPLIDLATRLQVLGTAPTGSVTVLADKIALTQPAAVAVTQTLEIIPELKANLADETALAAAESNAKAEGDKVIFAKEDELSKLALARTADQSQCTADKKALKAEAHKNSMKWFKRGFITGNITGFLGGLYAGHLGL